LGVNGSAGGDAGNNIDIDESTIIDFLLPLDDDIDIDDTDDAETFRANPKSANFNIPLSLQYNKLLNFKSRWTMHRAYKNSKSLNNCSARHFVSTRRIVHIYQSAHRQAWPSQNAQIRIPEIQHWNWIPLRLL